MRASLALRLLNPGQFTKGFPDGNRGPNPFSIALTSDRAFPTARILSQVPVLRHLDL